jgi:hypothetical protein
MKKLLIGLLLLLTMGSCLTDAKIGRNCQRFAQVCGTTVSSTSTKKDTTILVHDTVTVKLPSDTVKIKETVYVKDGIATMAPVTKTFGIVSATASISNSKLDLYAWINKPSMLFPHTDTLKIPGAIRETVINKVTPVKFIPKFYKFTFWLFIAELAVGIVVLLKKFGIFDLIGWIGKII